MKTHHAGAEIKGIMAEQAAHAKACSSKRDMKGQDRHLGEMHGGEDWEMRQRR